MEVGEDLNVDSLDRDVLKVKLEELVRLVAQLQYQRLDISRFLKAAEGVGRQEYLFLSWNGSGTAPHRRTWRVGPRACLFSVGISDILEREPFWD